jgi:hypothetical protein
MSGMISVLRCVRIRQALHISVARNACKESSAYNIKHSARDDKRRSPKQILTAVILTRPTYVPRPEYVMFANLWKIGDPQVSVSIYEILPIMALC